MGRLKKAVLITILTGVVAGAALPARAELQLKSIMTDLSARMQAVVVAIGAGDFAEIESNASVIADHDKPPMTERMKILGFLKSRASQFKKMDGKVHDNASDMAEAAKREDMEGVLKSFSIVLAGCVECHTGYRDDIVEHFYSQKE